MAKFLQGEGAVAEGVFYGVAKFGEGLGAAVGNKKRVVTKAAAAGWLQAEMAGADAFEKDGLCRG